MPFLLFWGRIGPLETGNGIDSEFLKAFNAIAAASDELRRAMGGVLSLCDLVKFSGYDPSPEEFKKCAGSAELILTLFNEQKEVRRLKGKT